MNGFLLENIWVFFFLGWCQCLGCNIIWSLFFFCCSAAAAACVSIVDCWRLINELLLVLLYIHMYECSWCWLTRCIFAERDSSMNCHKLISTWFWLIFTCTDTNFVSFSLDKRHKTQYTQLFLLFKQTKKHRVFFPSFAFYATLFPSWIFTCFDTSNLIFVSSALFPVDLLSVHKDFEFVSLVYNRFQCCFQCSSTINLSHFICFNWFPLILSRTCFYLFSVGFFINNKLFSALIWLSVDCLPIVA